MAEFLSIGDRLQERSARETVPADVMVELTYRCNLRCRHCYLDGLPPTGEPELSTGEVLALLEELSEMGTLYLALTGGEVFLRPDLWPILRKASELGFATRLFTNGTLLDEEWVSRLAELGTVWLDVSLHGAVQETHDWMTRCPGSFDSTMRAVERARAAGLAVTMKMPLTNRNAGERHGVQQIASSLGADLIADPIVSVRNCGAADTLCLRLGHSELVELFRDEGMAPAGSGSLTCNAGVNSASVTPYGEVRPCVQLLLDCGHLRQQSFRNVWSGSATLKKLRQMTDIDINGCTGCSRRDACARCPGLALLEDGDLLGPSSAACLAARARAEAGVHPPSLL